MKRIIIHWTAGRNKASASDRQHYHFVVEGDGTVVAGNLPPEANLSTGDGEYAAHTLNANTGAIGVALAAMWGAVERPFSPGQSPIMPQQPAALARLVAKLCQQYGIPVTRETVLTHAEVQPTLHIPQRGKWDITWLPGMAKPDDPVKTGDWLRAMISGNMRATVPQAVKPAPTALKLPTLSPAVPGWGALFAAFWRVIFGRGK